MSRMSILYFVRIPSDVAKCMYYTGIDPFSKQEVYVARNLASDRKLQLGSFAAILQAGPITSRCARRWNKPAAPTLLAAAATC